MGGTFSTPFGTPNKEQTRAILNTILREMFRRADLVDLYSLADSERCKNYIVVAERALDKLFVKINLEPKKGKDGVFYFQKIEGIQRANPNPAEQQQMCKELAFFFIRVFQVFAALTISVLDSDLPSLDPVQIAAPKKDRVIFINPPSVPGFPQPRKGLFSMRGGALDPRETFYLRSDLAGPYELLNTYLLRPQEGVEQIAKPMKFKGFDLTIPQRTLYEFNSPTGVPDGKTRRSKNFDDTATPPPSILYTHNYLDEVYPMSAQLFLAKQGNTYTVKLKNIEQRTKAPGKNIPELSERLVERVAEDDNPMTDKGKTLPYVISELFGEAFEQLVKPTFSAVNFLQKMKIINTIDQPAQLQGSKTYIPTVPKNLISSPQLPLEYKESMTIDGKTQEVRVTVSISITRQPRTITTDPQKYTVRVLFGNLSTRPVDIKTSLRYPNEMYQTFSTGMMDKDTPTTDKGVSIPQWLDRVFLALLKPIRDSQGLVSRAGIEYTREGLPKPYDSAAIPDGLKIRQVWEGLARDPPLKSHCTARALQLLSVAAIRGDMSKEAFSSVCNLKFPYVQDGSLPKPGQSITTEVGILALAKLFVDDLVGSSPKITEAAQWRTFSAKLKSFFERYETVEAELPNPEALSEIQDLKMPYCRGNEGGRIMLTPALAKALRQKALALISREGSHLRNVMRLMFKLFDERKIRTGTLEIHPSVMAGGLAYVNQLAKEARDVLIQYYGDCERTYKEGLFILYDAAKREPLTFRGQDSTGQITTTTYQAPSTGSNNDDLEKLGDTV